MSAQRFFDQKQQFSRRSFIKNPGISASFKTTFQFPTEPQKDQQKLCTKGQVFNHKSCHPLSTYWFQPNINYVDDVDVYLSIRLFPKKICLTALDKYSHFSHKYYNHERYSFLFINNLQRFSVVSVVFCCRFCWNIKCYAIWLLFEYRIRDVLCMVL